MALTHIEQEIEALRELTLEMMELVKYQLDKAEESFFKMDKDLAEQIIITEKKVNALELTIDNRCENIFALHHPLATDLRFVMAILKMISELERVGDHAAGIAEYVLEISDQYNEDLLSVLKLQKMFDTTQEMLSHLINALTSNDVDEARKVFKKDKILNEIKDASAVTISEFITENKDKAYKTLFLFSLIRKMERVGDLSKNIAEQIIFYKEALVVKHRSKK